MIRLCASCKQFFVYVLHTPVQCIYNLLIKQLFKVALHYNIKDNKNTIIIF